MHVKDARAFIAQLIPDPTRQSLRQGAWATLSALRFSGCVLATYVHDDPNADVRQPGKMTFCLELTDKGRAILDQVKAPATI